MKHKVLDMLDSLMIEYQNFEHVPVFTCDEAKWVDIPWERVKSLLLKNKKATNYYMVVLWDKKRLDVNKIREFFWDTKMSFVDSDSMMWLINVKPGSVSPYALINNEQKNIVVVFDAELVWKNVWLHPLQNDNTVVTSFENVVKYLDHLWFEVHTLEL